MKTNLDIIVSGGIDNRLTKRDFKDLKEIISYYSISNNCRIINIGCSGVETDALNFAKEHNISCCCVFDGYDYKESQKRTIDSATVAVFFYGDKNAKEYKKMASEAGLFVIDMDYEITTELCSNEPVVVPEKKTSIDFLQESIDVQKERGTEYEGGGKERSFEKMTTIFNSYTGKDLTPAHMALILQILKDVRQFSSDRYHHDSCLDSVSYASLKSELLFEQYNS